jgi:hypothetical protein
MVARVLAYDNVTMLGDTRLAPFLGQKLATRFEESVVAALIVTFTDSKIGITKFNLLHI